MLQTFEAEMQPNGMLHFSGFDHPKYDAIQKVLVTVMATEKKTAAKAVATATSKTVTPKNDWSPWLGVLKDSPNFNEDPQVIQQRLRDEWR
jgi:hypothetical protein